MMFHSPYGRISSIEARGQEVVRLQHYLLSLADVELDVPPIAVIKEALIGDMGALYVWLLSAEKSRDVAIHSARGNLFFEFNSPNGLICVTFGEDYCHAICGSVHEVMKQQFSDIAEMIKTACI